MCSERCVCWLRKEYVALKICLDRTAYAVRLSFASEKPILPASLTMRNILYKNNIFSTD